MEILDEFKKYLDNKYPIDGEQNTIKSYYSDIKQFLNFFEEYFGETIIDFKRVHVTEYKQKFLEKNEYKFSTINRKLASLSIYENFLIEKGYRKNKEKIIKEYDLYKIVRPYIPASKLPKKTAEKVKLKAGENSKRDYAMMVLFLEGGLRVSELVHLELKRDIDFDMFSIKILGKGNKIRTIAMEGLILEAIRDYLPEREILLNGKKNKYLFVSNKTANTNTPMCRTSINNILKKYCENINERKIHPHTLRHISATDKFQEGYSDLRLKMFLGHNSNATNVYTHPDD